MLVAVLALSVARLAPGATAPAEAAPRDGSMIGTVAEFDAALELRTKMAWDIRELSSQAGPDSAGKTMEDYAARFVFDPDRESRLRDLRAQAASNESAGDVEELRSTLSAASQALAVDSRRMVLIAWYFRLLRTIEVHESALETVMSKSPPDEARKTRERLRLLPQPRSDGLLEQLAAETSEDDRLTNPYEPMARALFEAYNDERRRLAVFAAESDLRRGIAPLSRNRPSPCSGPASPTSDSDVPVIDKTTIKAPPFPQDAEQYSIEGTVYVRAEVSASGCPERVQIERTGGFESLDAAALDWALGERFHPARKDGAAVAAPVVVIVTFRLTD